MKRKGLGWEVELEGWRLIDPDKNIINPFDLVTDENILMTDWEIQFGGSSCEIIFRKIRSKSYPQGNHLFIHLYVL